MATFECKVYELTIEEHPNADAIELARVGGYVSIVPKGAYQSGDLAVYLPVASIVPEWLIAELGLEGRLAGKAKNRVKEIKLRGIVSEGLIYPVVDVPERAISNAIKVQGEIGSFHHHVVFEGQDVTELLGVTKYEPPIPSSMSGEVFNAFGKTISFDIENLKKYPDILEEGEEVSITEKLHGCISSDSLVMLPNGDEITINEIISNDLYTEVLSYDIDAKEFITRKITGKFKRKNLENKKWMKLTFESNRPLKITKDHPLYSNDRNKWIKACEVLPDEDIKSPI